MRRLYLDQRPRLCYGLGMTELLLREIDEEVRKDRLADLWKRHGHKFIALSVVLVLGAIGYTAWVGSQMRTHQQATGQLMSVLQNTSTLPFLGEQKPDEAQNDADLQKRLAAFAAEAPEGLSALARLYVAGMPDTPEQKELALAEMKALAADVRVAPLYRDLASLLSVQLELDTGDVAALRDRLAPLMADTSAWRLSAMEFDALLSLRSGDGVAAQSRLETLFAQDDIPPDMKDRVGKVLMVLKSTSPVASSGGK